MVAFAGHPLIIEDRLVGVTELFARRPLSDAAHKALGVVADSMALGDRALAGPGGAREGQAGCRGRQPGQE